MDEPLNSNEAKIQVRRILNSGSIHFTKHSLEEMDKDGLINLDVTNVLRGGLMNIPAEFERGTWRYRFETQRIAVVIAFRSEAALAVITAWRK